MIVPLTLALWNKKRKFFTNPFFFFLIFESIAFFFTKSMGAFLSISIGLIIYFYLQRTLDKKGLTIIIGLLIGTGLIFILRQTSAKQHTLLTFSWIMRLNYWRGTLEIIKAFPLTGIGIGNFNLASVRYAHNSYLQIWAEMGILGIISFIWLITTVFKSAIKNINISANKQLMTGLITANVVFLIHNLFDFSFFLPEVALIWWLIVGLLLGSI